MIGEVRNHEAKMYLSVHGPTGKSQKVEAIIDTGFNASLTLPRSVIESLHLLWNTRDRVTLADGTEEYLNLYEAAVTWDRRRLDSVLVNEAECIPLVGMSLLDGCEVNLQVREGGKVTIRPLPKSRRK